jgi:hypothetical protein
LVVGSKKEEKFSADCTENFVKLKIAATFALRLSETQDAAVQLDELCASGA